MPPNNNTTVFLAELSDASSQLGAWSMYASNPSPEADQNPAAFTAYRMKFEELRERVITLMRAAAFVEKNEGGGGAQPSIPATGSLFHYEVQLLQGGPVPDGRTMGRTVREGLMKGIEEARQQLQHKYPFLRQGSSVHNVDVNQLFDGITQQFERITSIPRSYFDDGAERPDFTAPRPGDTPLSPSQKRLLADVGHQAIELSELTTKSGNLEMYFPDSGRSGMYTQGIAKTNDWLREAIRKARAAGIPNWQINRTFGEGWTFGIHAARAELNEGNYALGQREFIPGQPQTKLLNFLQTGEAPQPVSLADTLQTKLLPKLQAELEGLYKQSREGKLNANEQHALELRLSQLHRQIILIEERTGATPPTLTLANTGGITEAELSRVETYGLALGARDQLHDHLPMLRRVDNYELLGINESSLDIARHANEQALLLDLNEILRKHPDAVLPIQNRLTKGIDKGTTLGSAWLGRNGIALDAPTVSAEARAAGLIETAPELELPREDTRGLRDAVLADAKALDEVARTGRGGWVTIGLLAGGTLLASLNVAQAASPTDIIGSLQHAVDDHVLSRTEADSLARDMMMLQAIGVRPDPIAHDTVAHLRKGMNDILATHPGISKEFSEGFNRLITTLSGEQHAENIAPQHFAATPPKPTNQLG